MGMRILITAPPMLRMMEEFRHHFDTRDIEISTPKVIQTLSEAVLTELVPGFDGWIVGDDPVTARVLAAGKSGSLKAIVKWGVGVDNIDFISAERTGIQIKNTPGMFGREVADLAMSYITALARDTFIIDRAIRRGEWLKPTGISLEGKSAALAGFGNIGREVCKRMMAAEMKVIAYDPFVLEVPAGVESAEWPERLGEADFIIFTCSLTPSNRHMLNDETLSKTRRGVRVVNVSRGPLIDEAALTDGLRNGQVHSAALDVFEEEPLPTASELRDFDRTIFGSHNASNTREAVIRTSERAIRQLFSFLRVTGS